MAFILKILFYLCLYTGVLCVTRIRTLRCKFSDQESFLDVNGTHDVKVIHKEVILQFGKEGEAPVNPHGVTFLLTGPNLDLRLYLENKRAEQLACELHRYSTSGVHVQWPLQKTQDYSYWYNCIIKHQSFTVSSFLRQTSQNTAPGHHDYHHWTVIKDGDVLTTTVALIMKTSTPQVKAALKKQTKLDCQFVFDHKEADYTTEWFTFNNGKKEQLFSYNSQTKLTEGTGVDLKALQKGRASYSQPAVNRSGQRTFFCSVSLNPIVASLNIGWAIEEKPIVSLSVPSVLSIEIDDVKNIFCQADHYYPHNVEIVWYRHKPTASSQTEPDVLNKTHLSHRNNNDGTSNVSAYFTLHPKPQDSGTQFICSVFHQSLPYPVRQQFIIHVKDPLKTQYFYFTIFTAIAIIFILYLGRNFLLARRRRFRRLPY